MHNYVYLKSGSFSSWSPIFIMFIKVHVYCNMWRKGAFQQNNFILKTYHINVKKVWFKFSKHIKTFYVFRWFFISTSEFIFPLSLVFILIQNFHIFIVLREILKSKWNLKLDVQCKIRYVQYKYLNFKIVEGLNVGIS